MEYFTISFLHYILINIIIYIIMYLLVYLHTFGWQQPASFHQNPNSYQHHWSPANKWHETAFILSNVWFLFDNTEYFVLRPDLHKANTCTVLYSHKILISLHLSKKDYSLSLSRDSSARGPSRLDTTAKDIVDKDSENTQKSWQV